MNRNRRIVILSIVSLLASLSVLYAHPSPAHACSLAGPYLEVTPAAALPGDTVTINGWTFADIVIIDDAEPADPLLPPCPRVEYVPFENVDVVWNGSETIQVATVAGPDFSVDFVIPDSEPVGLASITAEGFETNLRVLAEPVDCPVYDAEPVDPDRCVDPCAFADSPLPCPPEPCFVDEFGNTECPAEPCLIEPWLCGPPCDAVVVEPYPYPYPAVCPPDPCEFDVAYCPVPCGVVPVFGPDGELLDGTEELLCPPDPCEFEPTLCWPPCEVVPADVSAVEGFPEPYPYPAVCPPDPCEFDVAYCPVPCGVVPVFGPDGELLDGTEELLCPPDPCEFEPGLCEPPCEVVPADVSAVEGFPEPYPFPDVCPPDPCLIEPWLCGPPCDGDIYISPVDSFREPEPYPYPDVCPPDPCLIEPWLCVPPCEVVPFDVAAVEGLVEPYPYPKPCPVDPCEFDVAYCVVPCVVNPAGFCDETTVILPTPTPMPTVTPTIPWPLPPVEPPFSRPIALPVVLPEPESNDAAADIGPAARPLITVLETALGQLSAAISDQLAMFVDRYRDVVTEIPAPITPAPLPPVFAPLPPVFAPVPGPSAVPVLEFPAIPAPWPIGEPEWPEPMSFLDISNAITTTLGDEPLTTVTPLLIDGQFNRYPFGAQPIVLPQILNLGFLGIPIA